MGIAAVERALKTVKARFRPWLEPLLRQHLSQPWKVFPLKREFRLPWREAGAPNHHDDKVDSDQWVVNKELSLPSSLESGGVKAAPAKPSAFRIWIRGLGINTA